MYWKVVLDAIQLILAKYPLVARHGDEIFELLCFSKKAGWVNTLDFLRVTS